MALLCHVYFRINKVHKYNTRFSAGISYSISKVRTNYIIYNIRFLGAKVWDDIDENIKSLASKFFIKKLKIDFIEKY